MKLDFIKVHGSQNDFFILDERKSELGAWTDAKKALLAQKLCDRSHVLGGADGILFVGEGNPGTIGKMRVFNSDGSEASMCGNGLRAVARYLLEESGLEEAKVETMKADLQVKKSDSLGFEIPTFEVEISPVLFTPSSLPFHHQGDQLFDEMLPELDPELHFSAVAVPNPHLISFVSKETLASDKQGKLASYLNGENPYFPDGVNVSFAQRLSGNQIFVRTFERGVGFTNACGTAMSASSLIKKLLDHDKLEEALEVYNDGGMVKVTAEKTNEKFSLHLIGNATFTDKGTIEISEDGASISLLSTEKTNEQEDYLQLVEQVKAFLQQVK